MNFLKSIDWEKDWLSFVMVVFMIVFCLSLLFLISFGIYHSIQIEAQPRFDGYIYALTVDDGIPYAKVMWDYEYKGVVYSASRKYRLTSAEFQSLNCGDLVEFDENNKPIFEIKEGE